MPETFVMCVHKARSILPVQGLSPDFMAWNAIQMAYYQADGIPKELRLWRGRLAQMPSATMIAMEAEDRQYTLVPDAGLSNEQSQQALA